MFVAELFHHKVRSFSIKLLHIFVMALFRDKVRLIPSKQWYMVCRDAIPQRLGEVTPFAMDGTRSRVTEPFHNASERRNLNNLRLNAVQSGEERCLL